MLKYYIKRWKLLQPILGLFIYALFCLHFGWLALQPDPKNTPIMMALFLFIWPIITGLLFVFYQLSTHGEPTYKEYIEKEK